MQGWICNSSICMTRRGLRPTGIAIFEAQQKGFPSVAHYVQVAISLDSAMYILRDCTVVYDSIWYWLWYAI